MIIYRNVKSKVFISLPENMDDLKIKVRSALDAVKQEPPLIQRADRDMIRRVRMCIDHEGRHIHFLSNVLIWLWIVVLDS